MERKEKLRIGTPEEVQTSIFQDVMILDSKISEIESELRETRDGKEEDGSKRAEGDGCCWS